MLMKILLNFLNILDKKVNPLNLQKLRNNINKFMIYVKILLLIQLQ